jgi:signal transduction histidine kinase
VISEALNNVVKHAHAKQVMIRGWEQGDRLIVEIADDGIGGADPESHGLRGMRDRVNALGGELDLRSPAGQGTQIILELPCV